MKMARHLLLALSFLTRIPVKNLDLKKTDFGRSVIYFPLVGLLIGILGGAIFWISQLWFSDSISICVSLGTLMLLTGALHEDGLADAFDAFGSKTNKEEILEVMRDSRIGTFGTLAVVVVFTLKLLALQQMDTTTVILAFAVAHMASRWATLPTLALLPYPRKSAAVTKRFVESVTTMPKWHLAVAGVYTVVACVYIAGFAGLISFVLATLVGLLLTIYFWRKIQGATGDCFGTIQQFAEVVVFLVMLRLS